MKPNLLIIPAAIRSHVLPSLYLADALADEYEVVYAVPNEILAEIVVANGYRAVPHSGMLVGYQMEASFVASQKQKPTYWRLFKAYRRNELYHARQRELNALIDQLRPAAVLIDLFACTDFWVLYPRRAEFKLLFFNPMPSTYRVKGFPIVSDGHWLADNPTNHAASNKMSSWNWVKQPKQALMQWAMAKQRADLQNIAPDYPIATDGTVTLTIANVPELLLAPLEFEFAPEVCKPNQHYLGLCQRDNRKDTELDAGFEEKWKVIMAQKQRGEQIVYCSFGTFHEGADAALLRFVTNLLEVLRQLPRVQLVCATNKHLIETLRHRGLLTAHTHFFTRVPQMQVLAHTDVFVTHAGFGSIKEAIYYGVPMLAYPLDPHYDQNGNALKLEHHGLGLRGAFAHERPNDLKTKLLRLLTEDAFREKVKRFRDAISHNTPEIPHSLLSTPSYETERC